MDARREHKGPAPQRVFQPTGCRQTSRITPLSVILTSVPKEPRLLGDTAVHHTGHHGHPCDTHISADQGHALVSDGHSPREGSVHLLHVVLDQVPEPGLSPIRIVLPQLAKGLDLRQRLRKLQQSIQPAFEVKSQNQVVGPPQATEEPARLILSNS